MKILGISGTNGAGKDSVGELLAERHGWLFISVSQILRDELARQRVPGDRHHTHDLSAQWRRQYGTGVLVDKAVEIYNKQKDKYGGLAIASLRNPGEADQVHKLGGKVIWIDADIAVRYQRVTNRRHGRQEDNQTFEKFVSDEQHQMHHSGDEATLSMSAVKDRSDIFIDNSHSDIEKFYSEVERVLGL
ncbi:AAA family ATPase [Candidatus Saccharibacteria bacterium]|jgi:cytidylate kinase|nr:AAA family ATPase [Candidatus Saccharibacteria bacterium]